MTKRLFDVTLSLVGLVMASPILLVAAIAVKCSSPGPILFRQERVGLAGRHFTILKFRTMRQDGLVRSDITIGHDPRITQVGAILRKWKIDELPQLLNVVRGEMSLVGPRPEVPAFVAAYPDELRRLVLTVRPGITDRASIAYRHENEILAGRPDPELYYREVILPAKLQMASAYARHHNLGEDLRILAATLRAIVRRS